MEERKEIVPVPQLPPEKSLAELYRELAAGVEGSNVAALILEDFRRMKQPFDLPQRPTELEVRIAVAYDVYRALTQGNGNLIMVPEWLEVSGRKILEPPFRADYLRSVDFLLRQRTSDGVDRARQILDIIGWTDDYRDKVISTIKDILLNSRDVYIINNAKYAVATLREMGAETELQSVEMEAIQRLISLPYDSKVSAAIVLRVLEKDKNERGESRNELRALVEELYARFPTHSYEVLHNMQKIGLSPDKERLLDIIESYRDKGQLYQARRMALALKDKHIKVDNLIRSIDGLIADKERIALYRAAVARAIIVPLTLAVTATPPAIIQKTQTSQVARSNYESSIGEEYYRARNWMTIYKRTIEYREVPNDIFSHVSPHEIDAVRNEWSSKGKEYALANIRAKIEGSIRNLTEYTRHINEAPLPEVQKAALRNIAWTYVKELQKGLEQIGVKK